MLPYLSPPLAAFQHRLGVLPAALAQILLESEQIRVDSAQRQIPHDCRSGREVHERQEDCVRRRVGQVQRRAE